MMVENGRTSSGGGGSAAGGRTIDAKAIAHNLSHYPPFDRFRYPVTLKLASQGCCEELERGIVLFREGDVSCNWYALLDGSIDVYVHVNVEGGPVATRESATAALVYTLTAGFAFGEEALNNEKHCCTAVVRSKAFLFRIERDKFRHLYTQYADELFPAIIPIKDIVKDFYHSHNVPYPQHHHSQSPARHAHNPSSSMWPLSLTRKLSSGSQSSPDQQPPPPISNGSKYVGAYHGLFTNGRHVMNGGSTGGESDSGGSPRYSSTRWRHRKTTAPAAVHLGNDPVHPTPDLLLDHVTANSVSPKTMQKHGSYNYITTAHDTMVLAHSAEPTTRPSAMKGSTGAKPGRNVVIASPSIMEQMCSKTSAIILSNGGGGGGSDDGVNESTIIIDATHQQDSDPLMRNNSSATTGIPSTARGQQKNVIELSSTMSSQARLTWAGHVLRAVMFGRSQTMVRDRKYHMVLYKRCMVGTEMVDWLIQNGEGMVHTRMHAVGMWQALVEEGSLAHVTHEYPFMDKHLLYRWTEDEGAPGVVVKMPTTDEQQHAQAELPSALCTLSHAGPDALFRMVLRKGPQERTGEELEVVFEELLNIKALSHLSTMVKRELAVVMRFEHHHNAGTILFRQGDEGKSWYIILKGSVNVVIHGKGTVCTLHEGDDFGKLALVNDAPRAATIILNDDNCQFLRVDKHDFNRILRDVEANTVRLKEHGRDVLVLEKIPIRMAPSASSTGQPPPPPNPVQHRYSVMAGTPEKMLEYLLETRIDCERDDGLSDTFMEDFLLTHLVFMPSNVLCNALSIYYQQGCSTPDHETVQSAYDDPSILAQNADNFAVYRHRVVAFLHQWISIAGHTFFLDPAGTAFVEEIYCAILEDSKTHPTLSPELTVMESLMGERERAMNATARRAHVVLDCGILRDAGELSSPVLSFDTCVFKVYNSDRTYVTLKARVDQPVSQLRRTAAQKLGMNTTEEEDGIELVEVKSSGERVIYPASEISVPSLVSLNGRLFACYKDQIDTLSPLPEQEGPSDSVHSATLELLGSSELSHQLLINHWQLFTSTHPYEFIYQTFGRHQFPGRVPTNFDLLVRRFNEVQFWVVTEIVLCSNVSKRAALVKKFIKVAAYSKALHDLLAFFAIVLGLSNVAVSRLAMTWDKVPTKLRKQFLEFESLLDPSRNHRAYRLLISKMPPPIIPFVPLVLKDLTFAHDGNKTYFDGLVNFEKMHMIAQTLRSLCFCKMRPLAPELVAARGTQEAQQLVRNFKVIDDQKRLLFLSQKLEPRKQSC